MALQCHPCHLAAVGDKGGSSAMLELMAAGDTCTANTCIPKSTAAHLALG